MQVSFGLEHKFCQFDAQMGVRDDWCIEGYASRFGAADKGGDIVLKGAYARSLDQLSAQGRAPKMLWQHDPAQPIGVWEEVREDDTGLWVKGRLLESVARAREAAALISGGAIDGLSIGYRTVTARKNDEGRRLLCELELWEVSLVTFPMLPSARVGAKGETPESTDLHEVALAFEAARQELAQM